VEEADVEWLFIVDHREEYLARMGFRVIIIHAVAGQSTHIHFVIWIVPLVNGQQYIFLV
jgi:hypothetical protein